MGEFPPDVSEEELGIAMTGGGRQTRGRGVSEEPQAGQALAGEGGPEAAAITSAARLAAYLQGGGRHRPGAHGACWPSSSAGW